ncbi:FAD-dependent oxidoreductase [Lysobacter pythonis]|uniref:FAD-dependent oxidoreductase n=1 Tax=Solilutibacter pythonis TaxID=2483112 RepID=A0A3M2HRI0_9GAMM|nr:FAD-dependent oxidoreductase [Lysobacter pythonis]RMH88384.1 FAD-dependent oxidoreductase [Lysobacter pythonis]
MSEQTDVVVVGAGAIGLSSALALARAGRSVTVIDAGRVGGGASHGNCGTLTPSHAPPLAAPGTVMRALGWMLTPDAPLYVHPRFDAHLWRWLLRFSLRCNEVDWRRSARAKHALLVDSRHRVQTWIEAHGLACEFVESGEDYVFRDERALRHEEREFQLLRELGVEVQLIDGAAYEREEPAMKPGVAGAIRFAGDAMFRPDAYVRELARAARGCGVDIIEHCALQAMREEQAGVVLATSRGERRAGQLVLAAGAWSPLLAGIVGARWLRGIIQPGKGYSITYDAPALAPKRPLVLRERLVCVTAWGSGYRLGSTMEFSGYDDSLNPRRLAALERGAAEYLRQPLGPVARERWFGWRPMSLDDVPLIGRIPGRRSSWLVTGHGMMGMGMSAGSGQLLADLLTGAEPAIDPTPFSPERFV